MRIGGAALGVVAAAMPLVATWGFTVDDALVTARVAHHLAIGAGYRFNTSGPPVDAVTPLGFAHLMAPFAREGVIPAWQAARAIGVAAWLAAAAWLGFAIGSRGNRLVRFLPLVAVATSAPLAAWAGSGMETGVVAALATVALGRPRPSLLAAGLAAAWRPELIPWAVTLAVGIPWAEGDLAPDGIRPGRIAAALAAVLGPILLVGGLRTGWFGSPTPLSLLAKPSDLAHGVYYAGAAGVWSGVPLLVAAPWGLLRATRRVRVLVLAILVHGLAIGGAGGDWMPMFRLAVPVIPGAVLIAAELAAVSAPWATAIRSIGAAVIGLRLLVGQGAELRQVSERRLALVEAARPLLTNARRVAALDVGWVGAVGELEVVDLAGITDPTIAVLRGGHTSKRIPHDLVDARDIDHVVLLLGGGSGPGSPWSATTFARRVEALVATDAFERGFELAGTVPLGGTRQRYLIVRRAHP